MSDRDIVLSYHDALIRQYDYKLLKTKEWLNDSLIEFWFEYLSHELFKENVDQGQLLCISPSLSQLIKLTDDFDEIRAILEPLSMKTKQLVLIPVNNSTSYESIGGSHWALLVFKPKELKFELYDSSSTNNYEDASNIACKLNELSLEEHPKTNQKMVEELNIDVALCHQQNNSYNCGIHLIVNSEAICRKHLNNDQRSIIEIASMEKIKKFREELIKIIDSLKEQ